MRDGHESNAPEANDWDEMGDYESVPEHMQANAPEDDQAGVSAGEFAPDENETDDQAVKRPGLVINGGDDVDGGVL